MKITMSIKNKLQMEIYKRTRKGILFLFVSIFYIILGTTQTFAADAVGKTTSSFSVSNSGAAVYDIAIKCPDGGSFSPQISLSYNSQSAGYGLAGFGFSISGLSVITKGGKDMFHDKIQTSKYSDYYDAFYLDGKRLIKKESTNDGYCYTVEGDPYTNVFFHREFPITSSWFEIKNTKGETYIYGKSSNSRLTTTYKVGTYTSSWGESWYLERSEDKYSNYITYEYATDANSYWVRPISIKYGLNDEHNRGIENCIRFEYQSLGDNYRDFAIGIKKGKIDKCISSITTTCNNTIYRKYILTYNETSDYCQKKWTRLTSVVEKNGDGEGESLPAIKINWQHIPTPSVRSTTLDDVITSKNDSFNTENDKTFTAIDLNNDGVSDIIRIFSCTYKESLGRGSSYSYPWNGIYISLSEVSSTGKVSYKYPIRFCIRDKYLVTTSADQIKREWGGMSVMDVDGDGKNDILLTMYNQGYDRNNSRQVIYTIINGKDIKPYEGLELSSFGREITSYNFSNLHDLDNSSEVPLITAYDKDGDGKDEVIVVEKKSGLCRCWTYKCENGMLKQISEEYISMKKTPQKMFYGDYNTDGLTDLILLYDGGYRILFNKEGSTDRTVSYDDFGNAWRVSQGDFDGDGLLDFVYSKEDDSYLYIAHNNGNGTFTCNKTIDIGMSEEDDFTCLDDGRFSMNVVDIDHDGLSDVVVSKANYKRPWFTTKYVDTSVKWLLSTGSSFKVLKSFTKDKEDVGKENYIFVGDFDGDGVFELANYGGDLSTPNNSGTEDVLRIYKSGSANEIPTYGKITSIENGLGDTHRIQYKNMTNPQVYSNTIKSKYPVMSYTLPMTVVSQVTDVCSSMYSVTNYSYKDMRLHIAGKGMLGFNYISKDNTTLGEKTTTEYTKWDEERWIPTEVTEKKYVGKESSTTVATSVIKPVGNNYLTYVSHKKITDLDGFTSEVITNYDVNEDRAFIIDETVKNDGDNMYKKVVYDKHVQILGAYLPRKVIKTQKHSDDNSIYTSTSYFTYDNLGDLTSESVLGGLKTEYERDYFGNVKSSTTSGNYVATITTNYQYDNSGRFIKKTSTNPLSSVIEYTHDIWGNVLTKSDVTIPSNVLTTTYTYDSWGKQKTSLSPEGVLSTDEWGWGSSNEKKFYVLKTTEGKPWVKTWYDVGGNETVQESVGPKGSVISTKKVYNSKGQVSSIEKITGNLITTETFTYDIRGRVLTDVIKTDGKDYKSTTYTYGKGTVTEEIGNQTRTTVTDTWGNVTKVTDNGGTIDYKYGSIGKPVRIGNMEIEYDTNGYKKKLVDPDAGKITYVYSSDGKIVNETDARGFKKEYTYDDLGRLKNTSIFGTGKDYRVYNNYYGTSGYDNLKLNLVRNDNNYISYKYDRFGNVINETRYIDSNNSSYTRTYEYNKNGQVTKTTYPGGLTVLYSYDEYGYNTQITANGQVVYKTEQFDGYTTSSSFLDKYTTSTTRTFSSGKFNTNIQIKKGTNVISNQNEFRESITGNMLSRQKNIDMPEYFQYDSCDRLIKVTHPDGTFLDMSYGNDGIMTYKSDMGSYTYDVPDHAHAVGSLIEGISSKKYPYDKEASTEFNDFGKVSAIYDDHSKMTLYYGPDQQRWRCSYSSKYAGNVWEAVYFDDYEKIRDAGKTREYYYVCGNVIIIKENGTFKPYLVFKDGLGSILTIRDENAKIVFDATYDVWGKQTIKVNSIGLKRGYTGHEHVYGYEFINMNGRIYDPNLAQFLSPDNYVQEPTNSQNFNRYSYCLNNPLKYTDPTGNTFVIDDVTIAFVVYGVASSMMSAAATGQNVWKAAGISILSQAATFGIGAAFGSCGGVAQEILRAGAHGLASGVANSLQGGSFGVGFASGAFSSAAGSAAQALKLGKGGLLVSSVLIGGTTAYISGGNFLQGAMNGLQVGLLNHMQHDSGNGDHTGGLTTEEIDAIVNEYKEQKAKYPDNLDYYIKHCGGKIAKDAKAHPNDYKNACAARLSGAMNDSGVMTIPHLTNAEGKDITYLGAKGKYYFMRAAAMKDWLISKFGQPILLPQYNNGGMIPDHCLIFQDGWTDVSGHVDVCGGYKGNFVAPGGALKHFRNQKEIHPTSVWLPN